MLCVWLSVGKTRDTITFHGAKRNQSLSLNCTALLRSIGGQLLFRLSYSLDRVVLFAQHKSSRSDLSPAHKSPTVGSCRTRGTATPRPNLVVPVGRLSRTRSAGGGDPTAPPPPPSVMGGRKSVGLRGGGDGDAGGDRNVRGTLNSATAPAAPRTPPPPHEHPQTGASSRGSPPPPGASLRGCPPPPPATVLPPSWRRQLAGDMGGPGGWGGPPSHGWGGARWRFFVPAPPPPPPPPLPTQCGMAWRGGPWRWHPVPPRACRGIASVLLSPCGRGLPAS